MSSLDAEIKDFFIGKNISPKGKQGPYSTIIDISNPDANYQEHHLLVHDLQPQTNLATLREIPFSDLSKYEFCQSVHEQEELMAGPAPKTARDLDKLVPNDS